MMKRSCFASRQTIRLQKHADSRRLHATGT
jgi:hypothetical protein